MILDYSDILRLARRILCTTIEKKQQIMSDNPELVLCENGDFKIKEDLVERLKDVRNKGNCL